MPSSNTWSNNYVSTSGTTTNIFGQMWGMYKDPEKVCCICTTEQQVRIIVKILDSKYNTRWPDDKTYQEYLEMFNFGKGFPKYLCFTKDLMFSVRSSKYKKISAKYSFKEFLKIILTQNIGQA